MRAASRGAILRRVLLGFACIAILALLTGWLGVRAYFPTHMLQVTGRADIEPRSCLYCHRDVRRPPTRGSVETGDHISPAGMVVSPNGDTLWIAAYDAERLLQVDLSSGRVVRSAETTGGPHGVAISADGTRVSVTTRDGDRVLVLDAATLEPVDRIEVLEPLDVVFDRDSRELWVASGFSDEILHADLAAADETAIAAGNEPYALALSPDGAALAVANRLARPVSPGVEPVSELTLIDARSRSVLLRQELRSAHLSEGVAISRDATFALAPVVRVRNLLPLTQVARGGVMNSAVAFVDLRAGGRAVQFPLDEVNAFFADPADVALTLDERTAFVAHGGADVVTAVDVVALRAIVDAADEATLEAIADDLGISSRYVKARIPTRSNPRAMALSPDGGRLYVAERLADSVAVIDTAELRVVGRIELGGPSELTAVRRGERVFHDASGTFQGQFSCRSCHPDGHTDGLVWDFEIDGVGRNLLETRSLRGIRDTAPFKWNGKNPSLHVQCGPRFARVLTRSDPFEPERLDDLVAYIESLALPPQRLADGLAESLERGRRIFFRTRTNAGEEIPVVQRCDTCHRPPLFTDRLKADVGSGGAFDTPHLFDIGSSPPYLHDGRALTLEEIWTVHSPDDTHGVTADLDKVQLNDLVTYLRSL